MVDFDRDKLSNLIDEAGMDELYFVSKVKTMIDKGGVNMPTGLKILGELKGLGKKTEVKNTNILDEFGIGNLMNSVQQNRRLKAGTEFAEIVEESNEH